MKLNRMVILDALAWLIVLAVPIFGLALIFIVYFNI